MLTVDKPMTPRASKMLLDDKQEFKCTKGQKKEFHKAAQLGAAKVLRAMMAAFIKGDIVVALDDNQQLTVIGKQNA